jgi:TonB-linked SusC/RagA family outer membrane protein
MKRKILQRLGKLLFTFLILISICGSVYAQTKKITGNVTDEKGQPLPGATIKLKSGQLTTSSDVNGHFTINAPENETTLIVTFVGYQVQEVPISRQSPGLTVKLLPDAKSLNEIVVVGYGTQRKKDVTGAVASVSAATLNEVPSPNLIDQLKGRTAGVSIVSNGATPGSAGSIRIRGNRTITNSQGTSDALDAPLIVLDGIPYSGSINDFSPEDIASVDILKDASATAIYGSRGAGGVILVTTKRGRAGKTQISYNAYYGTSKILDEYNVYNGAEYAQFKADAATYNRSTPNTSAYALTAAESDALKNGISTDWQKLIYRSAPINNQDIIISGGSEKTQFSTGINYYDQEGIIPNQSFKRVSLRSTLDTRLNDRIKVGFNTINTLQYTNLPGGSGVPSGLVRTTPLAAAYNADGSVNLLPAVGSIDANIVSPLTLITKKDAILSQSRRISTFNSLYGEVNIIEGLKYRLNVGLNFRQDNGNGYNGTLTYTNYNTSLTNASVSNGEAWTYNIQNLLYYNKVFAKKHRIDFTGLYEINKDHSQTTRFTATGVPADYIKNSNLALASGAVIADPNGNSFSESGLESFMARLAYAFDDRYLLTATIRRDGSSTLSPGNQWFNYPAVGLGWNVSNEQFLKKFTFINNLKIRGGWGVSGNRNVAPYATLGALSSSAYNFGTSTSGQQLAYYVSSLPNLNLGWQSTSQWDVGLDFSILNDRITGGIDAYSQHTKNILLQVALPGSIGSGSTFQNRGKTKGSGMEINLTTVNIKTSGGFNWSTDYSYSFNRESITELTTPGQLSDIGNGWFVGQPLSVIYDVKKIGIWQTADQTSGALAKQTSPVQFPGQIRVQDLDGDGKITSADRQIIGNFQPKWEGGFTNRFSYKAFDLSVVMYARMGMKVLVPYLSADGGANGFGFFNQGRVNQIKTNYWTVNNPTNDFPAPDAGTDRLNFGSTLAYQDGSFIKCRSINFGYNLPASLLQKAHITGLKVYVNVTNPFIIYSPLVKSGLAIDPEGNGYGGSVSSFGGDGAAGSPARQISVNLNNPSVRQFTVGINAKL